MGKIIVNSAYDVIIDGISRNSVVEAISNFPLQARGIQDALIAYIAAKDVEIASAKAEAEITKNALSAFLIKAKAVVNADDPGTVKDALQAVVEEVETPQREKDTAEIEKQIAELQARKAALEG